VKIAAGISIVIPMVDAIAATCIAIIIGMITTNTINGLVVPKYSTCAMVPNLILSTLAFTSKHWSLEYLVQEILSQNCVIASGGDCKI
jgi:hypothetical protein